MRDLLTALRTPHAIISDGANPEISHASGARIAVLARRRIKQNFAISIAYNIVAVPIALVGLATPLAAALAMSTSSVTVSLNSLRLK